LPPDLPGLSLGAISERSDEAPAGTIVAQLPLPDARASLYGTVDVAVSTVPTKIVPSLVGLTRTGAIAALATAGLALGTVTHRPARADPDTVVAQEPQAGTGWPRGARVAITVAGGRRVVVPNLIGLALEAAREALIGLGLSLGTATPATDPGAPGIVLSQEPAAQTTVGTGTAVNLVVRAGVPNFIGMNLGAASAVLESAGISLQRVDEQEREGPAGIVIAQDPAAGTAVTPATSMILVVSIAARLEVPALIGSSLEDARRVLESLGLALEVTDKQESDEPEGSILGQTPEPGTLVERGAQVEVLIAVARPQRAAVPDLIGLTAEQARAALAQVGLVIEVAGVRPTPRARPGTVVEQEPRVGQVVGAGTVVRVVLASADESIEVPDVRRMHLDAAAPLLERSSLRLKVSDSTGSVEREGTILTQDPVPGTRAPIGSVVSVVVSAGGFVVVPNVVNMLQALAIRRLAGVGLSAEVVGRFDLSRPVGTVLEQTPDAGEHAPVGGLVVIVVARRLITERPIPIDREPIFPAPRPRPPLEPVEQPPIINRRPQ
jgi:beta-lactam-binding protein with PASTA domain